MRNRPIKKQLWLSKEENYILKAKAQTTGMTESDLLRNLLVGFEPKEKPPIEFYNSIKEIRAVGKNINQLTRHANKNGFVDGINLKKEIGKLNEIIMGLKKEYLLPKEVE